MVAALNDALHAGRIPVSAIHKGKTWFVRQAKSVIRQLRAQAQ